MLRAWLEGDFTDLRLVTTAKTVIREMHTASLQMFSRVDRPYPLDQEVASTVLGAILERVPEAVLQHDESRSDQDIIELMATVIERSLLNAGPAR